MVRCGLASPDGDGYGPGSLGSSVDFPSLDLGVRAVDLVADGHDLPLEHSVGVASYGVPDRGRLIHLQVPEF